MASPMFAACVATATPAGAATGLSSGNADPLATRLTLSKLTEFILTSGASIESVVQRLNVHPMTLARAYRSQGIVAPYGLYRLAAIHRDYDAR